MFSESASTLELHTVPCHFGAKDFGRVNSLFRGGSQKERQAGWKGEQLVGSCIPVSGSSGPAGPRGQYANWAWPPDALMGTAFSFQSELLESYAPSLHSGRPHQHQGFALLAVIADIDAGTHEESGRLTRILTYLLKDRCDWFM